jgi:hypothetical protein
MATRCPLDGPRAASATCLFGNGPHALDVLSVPQVEGQRIYLVRPRSSGGVTFVSLWPLEPLDPGSFPVIGIPIAPARPAAGWEEAPEAGWR